MGESVVFREILRKVGQLARSPAPVLITGETGTGKEACARAIHYLSNRSSAPFIPINCSATPDHLFENEFFGHKRGAFTDAHLDEPGILRQAEGGTLFLDEIASLSLGAQGKILRVFEGGSYRALGSNVSVEVDLRYVCATNIDLQREVATGRFRADLFYRISVLRIELPPLRDRGPEEIENLSRYFLKEAVQNLNLEGISLEQGALEKLRRYHWPGNIRELKNIITRAVTLSEGPLIGPELIEIETTGSASHSQVSFASARRRAIEDFERRYLGGALQNCGNNITKLSQSLQKDRRTIQRLLRKYRLPSLGAANDVDGAGNVASP